MATTRTLCQVYNLGMVDYEKALRLQDALVSARNAGKIPDTVLFLQHPSVLTIGVSGNEEGITAPRDLLAHERIPVFHVNRGGRTTYHGPGQLVGYPVINLQIKKMGPTQYVRNLEEVIIRSLTAFSIVAHRDPKYPGVWVGQEKICAVGIQLVRGTSMHGFALNVNTDLKYFTYITPCGILDRQTTSMSRLLSNNIALDNVTSCITEQLAHVFDMTVRQEPAEKVLRYAN
jgi:lipoate-protein ligase B